MLAPPTATTALEQCVRGVAPLLARAAPVCEVVRAAALTVDEVRTIHDHHDHHDRMQIAGLRSP